MAKEKKPGKSFIDKFRLQRNLWKLYEFTGKLCSILIPFLWLIITIWVLYDIGFNPFQTNNITVNYWISQLLQWLLIFMGIRLLLELARPKKAKARLVSLVIWLLVLYFYIGILPDKMSVSRLDSNHFLIDKALLYAGIFFVFLSEASLVLQFIYKRSANPSFLFVASFGILILLGTLLLHLPNATIGDMRSVDALFTATSAVCVTGLTVLDTATQFTTFGQVILLFLIQAGGLGIMTFTGLLSYAVAGSISFRNELAFRDMFRGNAFSSVMRMVYRIVMVTLFFEALGAVWIYFSLPEDFFDRKLDKIFFAVFHSVSAFCNAGFSTYPNGLYDEALRFNYTLQLFIALLVILGGLGFPIVFNLFTYLRVKAKNLWCRISHRSRKRYIPRLININSRLALITSLLLLLAGFMAYWAFEQSGSLQQHPTMWGKFVTCFFGSVTPRTAGFNTVDLSLLTLPTIMIYLLLMWIGASPGSTGGGIKTTTLAVALLNMVSVIRGKNRTEFFHTEITEQSVRRAFSIMLLSILVIGLSVFLISLQDSDKGLVKIAFESFSAFSTVGLTLGITSQLSDTSKIVVVLTMFIGRVGALTMIIALVKQTRTLYYRYPQEDITF